MNQALRNALRDVLSQRLAGLALWTRLLPSRSAAIIPLLILTSSFIFAQPGTAIYGQTISPAVPTGTGQPANQALVRVCPYTATGTPCSPLANIFADQALTSPLSNPFSTDQFGNYSFFIGQGNYQLQITPVNGVTYPYFAYSPGAASVSSVNIALPTSVFSCTGGPITISGTIICAFVTQPGNEVFANCTGSTATPAFCLLTANMIPATLNGTTISGNLTVTGNESVGGTLGVTGATTLGALSAGNTVITGTLGVTGATTLSTLGVASNATVGGNLGVTGTLGVTGNTTLGGTLGVTGLATLSGNAIAPTFNATTGYQISGSYGTNGQFLQSTGSGTIFAPPPPGAVLTAWCGGTIGTGALGTRYIMAPSTPGTTDNCSTLWASGARQIDMPFYCTAHNLTATAITAGSASGSGKVTFWAGGGPTTLTCTLGTGNSCTDGTHTVAMESAIGGSANIYWYMVVESGQATDSTADVVATVQCN